MTRHVYRNPLCEKELISARDTLSQLIKHDYEHFPLGVLVEMQLARDRLNSAIATLQVTPKHIEEISKE